MTIHQTQGGDVGIFLLHFRGGHRASIVGVPPASLAVPESPTPPLVAAPDSTLLAPAGQVAVTAKVKGLRLLELAATGAALAAHGRALSRTCVSCQPLRR
jgi:hypothetical protein